jgi:AcrR family transcriptional regulator
MDVATEKKAKEKIIDAALEQFYHQGFAGTTVRQIAKEADVNVALISYYFGGKKGLLEQLMIQFYEGYFLTIEKKELSLAEASDRVTMKECFLQVIEASFEYLFNSYKMTRFIYRELTVDSMLIREVMTTYLAKEKYYYAMLLEEAVEKGELIHHDVEMMVLQLLNALYMPFLQPQVIREVHYIEPHSVEFKERYFSQISQWVTRSFQ